MWFISIKLSNFNWLTLTKCFERVSDRDWKARNKLKKRDINDHVPSSFISILFSWYHFNFFFHLILPMSLPLLLLLCYSLKQMVLFDHCIISTYSWHDTYSIYGCILYVLPPNAFCTDLTLLLALSLSQPGALCGVFIPGNVVFINCPSASFVLLAVCVFFCLWCGSFVLFSITFAALTIQNILFLPITLCLIFTLWFWFHFNSL